MTLGSLFPSQKKIENKKSYKLEFLHYKKGKLEHLHVVNYQCKFWYPTAEVNYQTNIAY